MESEKAAHDSQLQVKAKEDQINQLMKRLRALEKSDSKALQIREQLQKEITDLRTQKERETLNLEADRQAKDNEIAELYSRMTDCVEYKEKYVQLNNERQ